MHNDLNGYQGKTVYNRTTNLFFHSDPSISYYVLPCLVRTSRKCPNHWASGSSGKTKTCILVNIEEIINFLVFITSGDNYKNINWILGRGEEKMHTSLSRSHSLTTTRRIKQLHDIRFTSLISFQSTLWHPT